MLNLFLGQTETFIGSETMTNERKRKPDYFVGLDLAQAQEPSAAAVLERTIAPDPADATRELTYYAVRHLERWPPGTTYTTIIERVVSMFPKPPLRNTTLVIDQTGVGRAVVDLLRDAKTWGYLPAELTAVTITGGHGVNFADDGSWHVAKKHLVAPLQVLFQDHRFKIAEVLRDASMLVKELNNFRAKITLAGDDTIEDWRQGQHDDLVLAIAIAAWQAERQKPLPPMKGFGVIRTGLQKVGWGLPMRLGAW
jgi:hypothetical protein